MLVKKTASCEEMLKWFEANGQIVDFPLPGDVVFFKYPTNDRRTNHTGIVTNPNSIDDYLTIEGNTSLTSNDNGGAVMSRKRSKKNLVAFARPKYTSKDQINRLIAIASGEVGTTEYPPNSNNVKYNTWYYGRQVQGKNYPWCAAFVSWLFYTLDGGETKVYPSTIKMGSRGPDVKKAQQLLNQKGYSLVTDGDFGPSTQAAVKNFQRVSGLTDDGIIGPNTWEVLTK
jgi:hypothetical protein